MKAFTSLAARTGGGTRRLLATTVLVALLAFAAAGTASANMYRPQGGYGSMSLTCNQWTHEVTWTVYMAADTNALPQSVTFDLYYWNGRAWQLGAGGGAATRTLGYDDLGGSTYWWDVTSPLPGPYQKRYFYVYYYWFYGGIWNGPTGQYIGETKTVYC